MRRWIGAATAMMAAGAPIVAPTAVAAAPRVAVPPHHPETVLVSFENGVPSAARAALHGAIGARVASTIHEQRLDVVRLPRGVTPIAAAARYETSPLVAFAHPNWQVRLLQSIPNDMLFAEEWGLHNTGQRVTGSFVAPRPDADVDAPEGWQAAFGVGSFPSAGGARVGVLDTGIDRTHVELLGKTETRYCATAVTATGTVVEGTCSDDNLHGTHVAGTIAATTDNSIGVAGVAPNAQLSVFKALDAAGVGFYSDVVAGVYWLYDDAKGDSDVINMSIGGPRDDALDRALSDAYAAGTLLVAAAGNDGNSTATWPAFHRDVISVAATNAADARASFSNCNSDVEIAAPGVDVWSTAPGNSYAKLSGTSMATPHVSGVAAMVMWARNLDAAETRQQLTATADDLGDAGWDRCYGYGRVNLNGALGALEPPSPPPAPGGIAGSATEASTSNGVGGATVDCGSGGATRTASDGSFLLSNVPAGQYACTADATGYRPKSQDVIVDSGKTTIATFELRRKR